MTVISLRRSGVVVGGGAAKNELFLQNCFNSSLHHHYYLPQLMRLFHVLRLLLPAAYYHARRPTPPPSPAALMLLLPPSAIPRYFVRKNPFATTHHIMPRRGVYASQPRLFTSSLRRRVSRPASASSPLCHLHQHIHHRSAARLLLRARCRLFFRIKQL